MKVEQRQLADVIPYDNNPRKNAEAVALVAASIKEFGFRQPIVVDAAGVIIAGHTRYKAAGQLGLEAVPVHVAEGLTTTQVRAYRIADNASGERAEWDAELLPIELAAISAEGFDLDLLGFSDAQLAELSGDGIAEGLTDPDEIPDTPAEVVTKPGDLWQLGGHRLLCGDSTAPESVARLMSGELSAMIHADPPYGMGKEKDGIANDNLYRERLDAFQMEWWRAWRPHLNDDGTTYVWGHAAELWRLWYVGGLADSEPLTFRNEIVWDKGAAGLGIGTTHGRKVPQSERCLLFMAGRQEYNINADNYWAGWEPIRLALLAEFRKMEWRAKDLRRICGVASMYSHWFSKSQWAFIPEHHYNKLQQAAKGAAFVRDYAELEKEHEAAKAEHAKLRLEFYDGRAHFDNVHENMTDVWEFPRVVGEDRHGHATPKPVAMVARAIKTSTEPGAVVGVPFVGTGPEYIAAEQLGRKCYGVEISPAYCDVVVSRWEAFTGKQAERDNE